MKIISDSITEIELLVPPQVVKALNDTKYNVISMVNNLNGPNKWYVNGKRVNMLTHSTTKGK